MVFISAQPRASLFRIETINGPTTGILDAASEIIPLPGTMSELALAPQLLLTPEPLFNWDSISRL